MSLTKITSIACELINIKTDKSFPGVRVLAPKKYPFIVDIRELLRKELGIEADLSILIKDPWLVDLSLSRFSQSLEKGKAPKYSGKTLFEEVASFYLSLVIAKTLGIRVSEKIVEAEIRRAEEFLRKESFNDLVELGKKLNIKVLNRTESFPWYVDTATNKVTNRVLTIAIPLGSYLKNVVGSDEPELELQNSFLKKGLVYLDRRRFELLLIESIKKKIKNVLNELPGLDPNDEIAVKAKSLTSKYLKDYGSPASLEEIIEKTPPCIQNIINKAKQNGLKSLKLEEGLLIANFFASIREMPLLRDFFNNDEKINDFMRLVSIVRKTGPYIPTCSKLKELGLCPKECSEKTPFHAYIKNIKSKSP